MNDAQNVWERCSGGCGFRVQICACTLMCCFLLCLFICGPSSDTSMRAYQGRPSGGTWFRFSFFSARSAVFVSTFWRQFPRLGGSSEHWDLSAAVLSGSVGRPMAATCSVLLRVFLTPCSSSALICSCFRSSHLVVVLEKPGDRPGWPLQESLPCYQAARCRRWSLTTARILDLLRHRACREPQDAAEGCAALFGTVVCLKFLD